MSKIRWIVSNDLGSQSDIIQLVDELKSNEDVDYIPVSLEQVLTPSFKPDIPVDDIPTIFYGPVNFVTRMGKLGYKPGVYGTPDTYSYDNICNNIPHEFIFNDPEGSHIVTATDVINSYNENEDYDMFFKPYKDDKSIIGSVKKITDIVDFCKQVLDGKIPDVDGTTKFVISTPYGITVEYRLFVVDGKIISGSEYNPDKNNNSIPNKVIEFGNKIIEFWRPEPFFVLDIVISNNNCFVMEIQNFHSAGFYSSDIGKIVNSINQYLKGIIYV